MPVVSTAKHPESRSFQIVCAFAAPVEKVWQLWADPRKVERWWGPPGYPATFLRHDLTVPGRAIYHMPGPDGEPTFAYWRFLLIEPPTHLEIENGFGDEQGEPAGDIPSSVVVVELEPAGEGTRMTVSTRFETVEALEQLLSLGMQEGMAAALGQADGVLAEG